MDDKVLDEIGKQEKIHYNYGGGSAATKGFGYIIMALGVAATYKAIYDPELISAAKYITLVIVLFGAFLSFTTRGIIINVTTKDSKRYTRILGIPFGKLEPIERYVCISVLSKRYNSSVTSRSNLTMNLGSDVFYEINLLNKTHRVKYLIKSYDSIEEATKEMKILAPKLGVQIVKYAPVVSQKTKDRRR